MAGYISGQLIKLADGRHATIRFIGPTRFAPGEWIGLELEDASGKNDGSVQGERYFECEYGYGMFVRAPAIIEIIEQPKKEEPRAAPKSGLDGRGRPPSMAMGETEPGCLESFASPKSFGPVLEVAYEITGEAVDKLGYSCGFPGPYPYVDIVQCSFIITPIDVRTSSQNNKAWVSVIITSAYHTGYIQTDVT
ncbi:dynactin [Arthroderma uncinatum]|uniref:dynactin n=1 Tax=Arthroderma uncinatum TaxID=74035 RepID=UPI00144A78C8|nr:dynactin [Arthroderma uncinatum]KAF3482989.1 dynactin [Arthroderma uncinatum]